MTVKLYAEIVPNCSRPGRTELLFYCEKQSKKLLLDIDINMGDWDNHSVLSHEFTLKELKKLSTFLNIMFNNVNETKYIEQFLMLKVDDEVEEYKKIKGKGADE